MTDAQREAEILMKDPATSFWLKRSLAKALDRDPVDAFHDAQVLCRIVTNRASEVLESALTQVPRKCLKQQASQHRQNEKA